MRSGSLLFEGKRVSLREITGNVDKGSFSLRGYSDWSQTSGLVSDIDIGMQNLPFTWQNSFYATLDGKIHWSGSRWEGDIDIVEGHYYRPFRLLNMLLEPTPVRGEPGPFSLAAIQSNGLDLKIRDLGSLYAENNVAELVLNADLHAGGTVGTPILDGTLEVQSGKVNFMGFSFDDTSGEIVWNNQTADNPSVDIKGSREVADYEIHALLSGALTNLRLSFESDPPLSPNEVIQVLLSGESPETAQSFNRNFLSTQFAASQLLNLLQGPLSDISRLDTVKLASERSETDPTRSFTRIYFGKQITPRLNLNYSTSIGAENEFQGFEAEYLISDHFLIKAGKRDETRYGFDLTVRFEAN
jgi:translocation and assembly module TamB